MGSNEKLFYMFRNPSPEYGNCPWWHWDGDMRPEEIEFQMEQMCEKGIRRFMLAPMHTLELEFPERPWFEAVLVACRKAKKLGMKIRIWDEYNWPTGSAGGKVVQVNPDFGQRTARIINRQATPDRPVDFEIGPGAELDRALAVRIENGRVDPASLQNISNHLKGNVFHWRPQDGQWQVIASIPRFAFGRPPQYLDVFDPEAVQCFIDLVLERYTKHCGEYFGDVIEGFFHDEPHQIRFSGPKSKWTGYLEPEMVWGKNLWDKLGYSNEEERSRALLALFHKWGAEVARIRAGHWLRVGRLYGKTFFKPLADWAERHGVEYSGHTFEQDPIIAICLSDYYETMHHQQIPAVDILQLPYNLHREYRRTLKTATSLAKTTGRRTAFAEGPGCLEWGVNYEQLKWSTDWLVSMGMGMQMPNCIAYSNSHSHSWIEPSLGYQWTMFKGMDTYEQYVRRLYAMINQGEHVIDIGVIYPSQTYQANFVPYPPAEGERKGIDSKEGLMVLKGMDDVCGLLIENGHDYEYIYPQVLLQGEITAEGRIRMGKESFSILIFPPTTVVMPGVMEKIEGFISAGGRVIFCGLLPEQALTEKESETIRRNVQRWLGTEAAEVNEKILRGEEVKVHCTEGIYYIPHRQKEEEPLGELLNALEGMTPNRICIEGPPERREFGFYHKRADEYEIFFLANMSGKGDEFTVSVQARGYPELWDPLSGEKVSATFEVGEGKISFRRKWEPREALFLVVDRKREAPPVIRGPKLEAVQTLPLDGPWDFSLNIPNSLPVREARWSQAPGKRERPFFTRDFRISFDFQCREPLPKELFVLVDNLKALIEWNRVKVEINGRPAGVWQRSPMDHSWYQADITAGLRPGENRCVLLVKYHDHLNFEKWGPPCDFMHLPLLYLYGKFRREKDETLVDATGTKIEPGSWAEQGFPYFSGTGIYHKSFRVKAPKDCRRVVLDLGQVRETARVILNGHEYYRPWRPFAFDITKAVKDGLNELEVVVANTYLNMMLEVKEPSGLLEKPAIIFYRAVDNAGGLK